MDAYSFHDHCHWAALHDNAYCIVPDRDILHGPFVDDERPPPPMPAMDDYGLATAHGPYQDSEPDLSYSPSVASTGSDVSPHGSHTAVLPSLFSSLAIRSDPNVVFADENGFWISEFDGIPVGFCYGPPSPTLSAADAAYASRHGVHVIPSMDGGGYDVDYSYPAPFSEGDNAVPQTISPPPSAARSPPTRTQRLEQFSSTARYRRIAPSPPAHASDRADAAPSIGSSVKRSLLVRRRSHSPSAPYPLPEHAHGPSTRSRSRAQERPRRAHGTGRSYTPRSIDDCEPLQHNLRDVQKHVDHADLLEGLQTSTRLLRGPEPQANAPQDAQTHASCQAQTAPTQTSSSRPRRILACLFCRDRKIACGQPPESSGDRTCDQCARRKLVCEYPTESKRGIHKRTRQYQVYARSNLSTQRSLSPNMSSNGDVGEFIPYAVQDSIPPPDAMVEAGLTLDMPLRGQPAFNVARRALRDIAYYDEYGQLAYGPGSRY
ncbi:hypothetical protein PUNSTDRAFT_140947 [Punctularia strigosozonata HHB-11173 SS5]|uniref:uncharacterized protein n=1 Tax=Punctularia strigosozonata (strain HHB-11173) TaxID=741275 RepID=UPI0004418390|nr:uncharacterized protein PUNSTDRAFT_140947 [Punctularia strigosozonata HHB-11173 SS5]EIN14723.1 hypothetical protein PUNSTDRAFT_140947 [Punctularia strigosozonata HHB-11173 SS5]